MQNVPYRWWLVRQIDLANDSAILHRLHFLMGIRSLAFGKFVQKL